VQADFFLDGVDRAKGERQRGARVANFSGHFRHDESADAVIEGLAGVEAVVQESDAFIEENGIADINAQLEDLLLA
jgi:hypothetical protein